MKPPSLSRRVSARDGSHCAAPGCRHNTGHNLHGDLRRCDVPTTAFRSSTNPCQVHALVVPLVSRPHCVAVKPAFRRPDRTPDSRDSVDQRHHAGRDTAPGSAGEGGELRRPEEKALGLPSARPRAHAVAYPACHARPRNGGPRRCTTRERPRAYKARTSGAGPGRRSHSIAPCGTSRRVPARDGPHCAAPACRHNTGHNLRGDPAPCVAPKATHRPRTNPRQVHALVRRPRVQTIMILDTPADRTHSAMALMSWSVPTAMQPAVQLTKRDARPSQTAARCGPCTPMSAPV